MISLICHDDQAGASVGRILSCRAVGVPASGLPPCGLWAVGSCQSCMFARLLSPLSIPRPVPALFFRKMAASSTIPALKAVHDGSHKFVVGPFEDGSTAFLEYRALNDSTLEFYETFVPKSQR